jgi:hypothetical protein
LEKKKKKKEKKKKNTFAPDTPHTPRRGISAAH